MLTPTSARTAPLPVTHPSDATNHSDPAAPAPAASTPKPARRSRARSAPAAPAKAPEERKSKVPRRRSRTAAPPAAPAAAGAAAAARAKPAQPAAGQQSEDAAPARADAPAPKARARHAHLFITHVDPWSVMKNAFMFALAVAIVLIVAVTVLWSMLSLSGTLAAITRTLTDIAGGGANTLDAASLFSFSRVVGITSVIALLEVILVTALATLFAFLYNLSVGITGGLQVTLTDDS